jgi:hypothetical protein
VFTLFGGAALAVPPKPYQWTTAQASAAIKQQSAYVYRDEQGNQQSLVKLACRGTGKAVQRRYVAFRCTAKFTGAVTGTLVARTRKAGGLCWSLTSTVPGACLAAGTRVPGSIREAFLAWRGALTVSPAYTACVANGSGFYSCWWSDTVKTHRGYVVFSPSPRVKMRS